MTLNVMYTQKFMMLYKKFRLQDTLTGFKWIAQKAVDLMAQNYKILFAFEEAIGFMCGTQVKDKDGITAAVCAAKLAIYLYNQEKSLCDKLREIYEQ